MNSTYTKFPCLKLSITLCYMNQSKLLVKNFFLYRVHSRVRFINHLSKLFKFAQSVFKFQRVCYLVLAVPGIEDLLARIVTNHGVVSEPVDKRYVWISSTLSSCVIGVVDGGCATEAINAVNNTTRDKRVSHVALGFRRNTTVSI